MELIELENMWRESEKRMAVNNRLNKEILKRMLINKPETRLNWMKINAVYRVLSPILFYIGYVVLEMTGFQFRFTVNFYIGLSLFIPIYTVNYIWDIKYFLLIRKVNLSAAVLTIKKEIAELEKYKIKTTKIRHLLMPFAIIGGVLMFLPKPVFNIQTIVMLVLIVLVFAVSAYYRFRYSIYERFKKLNKEIKEIEYLEQE